MPESCGDFPNYLRGLVRSDGWDGLLLVFSWQRVDRIFRTGRGDFKSKMMILIYKQGNNQKSKHTGFPYFLYIQTSLHLSFLYQGLTILRRSLNRLQRRSQFLSLPHFLLCLYDVRWRKGCKPVRMGRSGRSLCAVWISKLLSVRSRNCLWNLLWMRRAFQAALTIVTLGLRYEHLSPFPFQRQTWKWRNIKLLNKRSRSIGSSIFKNRLTKLYAPAYKVRSIRIHGIITFIGVCSINQEKSCIEDASITFPMTYIIMT